MSAPVKLVAVNAGLSDPSSTRMLVDRMAEAVGDRLARRDVKVELTVIDLREVAADVGASMATGFPTGAAVEAIRAVEQADGLIAATPVFNASYSGLFKAFFDLVDVVEMTGKPVLIGATGGSPRHSMVLDHALRPMFSYLRTVVVPTGVYAASGDWADNTGDTTTLAERIERAAAEFAALLSVEAVAVPEAAAPQSDSPVTKTEQAGIDNFARLLGGA